MRLLRAVPGSVLWLAQANEEMAGNLRREARQLGVDPARLVFAAQVPLPEHLARQRLAGLFLDSTPYNAGATAVASLWSGIPLLTVLGETFVGRMAASIAHEINTPVGTSLTVASSLERRTAMIADELAQGNLKRSTLNEFLENSHAASSQLVANLNHAAEMIQSFKQVATDRNYSNQRVFDLGDLTEQVRVIHDGREEIDRLHQPQFIRQAVNACVIVGVKSDQHIRIALSRQLSQHGVESRRIQFRGATRRLGHRRQFHS